MEWHQTSSQVDHVSRLTPCHCPVEWPLLGGGLSHPEKESRELQILWDGIVNVLNKSFQIVRFPTLQQNA